jgi:hypothetical protein
MTIYRYTYITSTSDLFYILIYRFVSVIVKNKEVIFIFFFVFAFTFFWLLYLEYVYNFFLNQSVLSEDSSILNVVGESSSQGSSKHNISGGGGSSNNPHPHPDRGPGPHFGTHPCYWDTVMVRDTDRLADYLVEHKHQLFQTAGIHFGDYTPSNYPSGHNPEYSRIAKFVRHLHPEWFYHRRPDLTSIGDGIIDNIRAINRDVPRVIVLRP